MVLAFGALEPLVVAAATLSRGVLVAAAGVVVVLAILLVFVMVLRGGGSSRRKPSGLDYDAQEGPLGQPHAPANDFGPDAQAAWSADQRDQRGQMGRMGQMAQMGQMSQLDDRYDAMGQGRGPAAPQQAPNWGDPFGGPAQANGAEWGAPNAAQGRWNDQAPVAGPMGQPMGAANDWGAPPAQGGPAQPAPWDAPAPSPAAWNGANAAGPTIPAGRPAAPQWDAPAQPAPWDAPAAPSQPQWNQPQTAAPSQPQWNGQAPNQPQWGAPQSNGMGQQQWNGQAPSQPQWNGQPDPMMAPTAPRGGGYGPRLIERKPDGSGREFDLTKERLTIGRHRDSDVFLEDLAVSRLHTTVTHDPSGRFILRDENSANGTFVNGQRVTGDYPLKDGDEVQVGQTVLVYSQR